MTITMNVVCFLISVPLTGVDGDGIAPRQHIAIAPERWSDCTVDQLIYILDGRNIQQKRAAFAELVRRGPATLKLSLPTLRDNPEALIDSVIDGFHGNSLITEDHLSRCRVLVELTALEDDPEHPSKLLPALRNVAKSKEITTGSQKLKLQLPIGMVTSIKGLISERGLQSLITAIKSGNDTESATAEEILKFLGADVLKPHLPTLGQSLASCNRPDLLIALIRQNPATSFPAALEVIVQGKIESRQRVLESLLGNAINWGGRPPWAPDMNPEIASKLLPLLKNAFPIDKASIAVMLIHFGEYDESLSAILKEKWKTIPNVLHASLRNLDADIKKKVSVRLNQESKSPDETVRRNAVNFLALIENPPPKLFNHPVLPPEPLFGRGFPSDLKKDDLIAELRDRLDHGKLRSRPNREDFLAWFARPECSIEVVRALLPEFQKLLVEPKTLQSSRVRIRNALERLGVEAIPVYIKVLEEAPPQAKRLILDELINSPPAAEKAISAIKMLLQDGDQSIRLDAALTLVMVADRLPREATDELKSVWRASEDLEAFGRKSFLSEVQANISPENQRIAFTHRASIARIRAAGGLIRADYRDRHKYIEALIEGLKSRNLHEFDAAVTAFCRSSTLAKDAAEKAAELWEVETVPIRKRQLASVVRSLNVAMAKELGVR